MFEQVIEYLQDRIDFDVRWVEEHKRVMRKSTYTHDYKNIEDKITELEKAIQVLRKENNK